jgi:hypothetical protein
MLFYGSMSTVLTSHDWISNDDRITTDKNYNEILDVSHSLQNDILFHFERVQLNVDRVFFAVSSLLSNVWSLEIGLTRSCQSCFHSFPIDHQLWNLLMFFSAILSIDVCMLLLLCCCEFRCHAKIFTRCVNRYSWCPSLFLFTVESRTSESICWSSVSMFTASDT